jgi:hypothetical protein
MATFCPKATPGAATGIRLGARSSARMLATGHSPTTRGRKRLRGSILAARAKMIGLCALAFKGDLTGRAWGLAPMGGGQRPVRPDPAAPTLAPVGTIDSSSLKGARRALLGHPTGHPEVGFEHRCVTLERAALARIHHRAALEDDGPVGNGQHLAGVLLDHHG